MFLPLFIAFLVQGLLLGLVVLALLAAAPKLQKRYGPRWLCRLWVALARAEVKDNSAGAQMLVSADDTLQWTFQVADRWEEGGRTFFRYEMAGSNYSAGVKSWSVVVPFNGEVTLEDAWNCKASASGTRLTVANGAHNGNVPAGGFVRDVGFIVSGPADLAVVEYE